MFACLSVLLYSVNKVLCAFSTTVCYFLSRNSQKYLAAGLQPGCEILNPNGKSYLYDDAHVS